MTFSAAVFYYIGVFRATAAATFVVLKALWGGLDMAGKKEELDEHERELISLLRSARSSGWGGRR